MLPREFFLKWCNLMRSGVYFATILQKKNIVKIFIFIKIKDIVLLRTIFRGTLEHTPQNVCLLCNLVRFGLHFLRTFSEANIII